MGKNFKNLNITAIIAYLKDNKDIPAELSGNKRKTFIATAKKFFLENNKLFYRTNQGLKRYFTDSDYNEKVSIVATTHNTCHWKGDKLHQLISQQYHGISWEFIRTWVETCEKCNSANPPNTVDPIKVIKTKKPRERYQMDIMVLKQYADVNDGYKYILNIIDCYSKYAWYFPLKTKTATEVSIYLKLVFDMFGPPFILHTDNGKEFTNKEITKLCEENFVMIIRGRPYHPRSQGQVERFNQTVKRLLTRANVFKDKRWVSILGTTINSYNRFPHQATKKAPFKLFLNTDGYNLKGQAEAYAQVNGYNDNFIDQEKKTDTESESGYTLSSHNSDEIVNEPVPSVTTDLPKTSEDELIAEMWREAAEMSAQVESHNESYLNRMVRNKNQNNRNSTFKVNEIVFIIKDTDGNARYNVKGLETYCYEQTYMITKVLDGSIVEIIKMGCDEEPFIILVSRLKHAQKRY